MQTRDSKWTTSARTDVHHLRHTHNAILVGVHTVLHDNPFLTTRLPHGGKNPIQVILDQCLRTPKTAHVITDSAVETIIFRSILLNQKRDFSAYSLVLIELISEEDFFGKKY